jgi:hypothetical protein
LLFAQTASNRSSAAYEVHDDGDKGEQEQQMNQKTAHVQNEEAAEPEQNQNYSQDKKHGRPLFSCSRLALKSAGTWYEPRSEGFVAWRMAFGVIYGGTPIQCLHVNYLLS